MIKDRFFQFFELKKLRTGLVFSLTTLLFLLLTGAVYADEPDFEQRRGFGTGFDTTYSVVLGDLDDDGDLDLVTGNRGEPNQIHLNDGAGYFDRPGNTRDFGPGNDTTYALALGDVDGDGDLDIAVGNQGGQNVIYLNDGQANFNQSLNFGSGADNTTSLAFGDVNGDGRLDLVVGNQDETNGLGEQDVIYLNDGAGQFGSSQSFGGATHQTGSVALGDFNGDGLLDIVAGGKNGDENLVYLNKGDLSFNEVQTGHFEFEDRLRGQALVVGDLNGDGFMDFASTDDSYLNDGVGNFSLLGFPGGASASIGIGDLNGDGDLDLVTGRYWDQNNAHLNDGAANMTQVNFGAQEDLTTSVVLGDVDGDGYLDIIVGNSDLNINVGEQNWIYFNKGQGDFNPDRIDFGLVDQISRDVAMGDLDQDGDLDLIVANEAASNDMFLNDGAGNLDNGTPFGPVTNTYDVVMADFNGDTYLDWAFANYSQTNSIYYGDGAGSFIHANDFGSGTDLTTGLAVADLDSDGDLDLAATNQGQANLVYLNDGLGNFYNGSVDCAAPPASVRCFGTGTDESMSVAIGDIDGDGSLDLVTGNDIEQNIIYLNDGQGYFDWSGSELPFGIGSDRTRSVAVGDLDGDGDLDLVSGNYDQQNVLYFNQLNDVEATDVFLAQNLEGDRTYKVVLGDVNGDGHLDLVVANGHLESTGAPEGSVVYLNDGTGQFPSTSTRTFGNIVGTLGVALGDLDNDGDLDLAAANANDLNPSAGVNHIYPNLMQASEDLANSLPVLALERPLPTGNADFYSSPVLLDDQIIPISYTLFDPEQDSVGQIKAYYSLNGGGDWRPALAASQTLTTAVPAGGVRSYQAAGLPLAIPDQGTISATLNINRLADIVDLDVWVVISHTNTADLTAILESPGGTRVTLFDLPASGSDFAYTVFSDQVTTSITIGTPPFNGVYQPQGSLAAFNGESVQGDWKLVMDDSFGGNTGSIRAWGLRITTKAKEHVYYWDTFASGVFGRSDNVVFRMEAHPQPPHSSMTNTTAYTDYTHNSSSPYARSYVAATTFPFGLQGTQIRVLSGTQPISNAIVYRLPAGQVVGGTPLVDGSGLPLRTDGQGYLRGRGQIGLGDQLLALAPVDENLQYEGLATFDGNDDYVIRDSLSQTLITETTVAFWMQSEDTSGQGTPLSYATTNSDNAFLITNYNNFVVQRGASSMTTGVSATDGEWHYIVVTWQASDGQTKFYKDGELVFTGTLTTTSLSGDGVLVLGQDQDSLGGGFDPAQAFEGSLDEVRMWREVRTQDQIQADMIDFLDEQASNLVLQWSFDERLESRVLDQSPNGYDGQLVGAVWIGASFGGYTVYFTNGSPTETGVDGFTVTAPGIQVITVSAANPLLLFDIDMSLEWDASEDSSYLDQLEFDLKKTSQSLYDFTNGQVALGQVNVYQNADNWADAHVIVQATNRLRPFAIQGGLVTQPITDPQHANIVYYPGQVRIGSTWNRYGSPGQNIGQDWPLILAHELSHLLLYLDDTYLGFDENGFLIPVDTCTGSAMGDVYVPDNTEFIADEAHWTADCANTLTQKTLDRTEWETLHLWYPWLNPPSTSTTNTGPGLLPYNLTAVKVYDPISSTNVVEDPTFFLDYQNNAVSSSEARALLLRDDYIIDLGNPVGGQNRVLARGIQPGDRLCVFDDPRAQYGCEVVAVGDERLALEKDETWTPLIQLTPVDTRTLTLEVASLPVLTAPLKARLYFEYGPASEVVTLTQTAGGYSGTFSLDYVDLSGHIQLWVDEPASETDPRRETIVSYAIGGNPGFGRAAGGFGRAAGGFGRAAGGFGRAAGGFGRAAGGFGRAAGGFGRAAGGFGRAAGGFGRAAGAPLLSPDGQMIFFTENPLAFTPGDLYTIQGVASLPARPDNKIAIGQGYNLVASSSITKVITGSISFQYLGNDVLVEGVDETDLAIHFWDGSSWQVLDTVLDTYYNLASAPGQGSGIYALLAGVTLPQIDRVSPPAATNDLTTTLVISGGYFMQPLELALVGPTATYTLPLEAVSPHMITTTLLPGLPPREYQVMVTSFNQPGGPVSSPDPVSFALYRPAQACFYDFFESGSSKWTLEGDWGIVTLPDGETAMTDSPGGSYDNATLPSLTKTTAITSVAFDLSNCDQPLLSFRHDYVLASLEGSQDVARIEISADKGATWTTIEAYTGGGYFGPQVLERTSETDPEWTDPSWQTAEIGLNAYTGTVQLRLSLEVDQTVTDKGWVFDDLMVVSGARRQTDLALSLGYDGPSVVLPGQTLTYTLTLTNAGPDRTDALLTGLFSAEAISQVHRSDLCWADDKVLCRFDELTGTQTLTLSVSLVPTYTGIFTTEAILNPTYPYLDELNLQNNRAGLEILVQPPTYTLKVTTIGTGTVTVDPDQPGYEAGTVITLTATPGSGSFFTSWTGDVISAINPLILTIDSDKVITATFSTTPPVTYTLTTFTVGNGRVTPSNAGDLGTFTPPSWVYLSGTLISLSATADSGWQFSGWSGHLSGTTNPDSLLMDSDKVVTATFTLVVGQERIYLPLIIVNSE